MIQNFTLFFAEKYKIASDSSGSGNTANIGSIKNIDDIINERGIFAKLGETIFDDYWINYGQINITDSKGNIKKITKLAILYFSAKNKVKFCITDGIFFKSLIS